MSADDAAGLFDIEPPPTVEYEPPARSADYKRHERTDQSANTGSTWDDRDEPTWIDKL